MDYKQLVSIGREDLDNTDISGVILKETAELLMMQEVYDFILDGIRVIRQKDVSDVTQFNTDIFQTDRLKALGLYEKINFDAPHDITNWHSLFESLSDSDTVNFIIVEDEHSEAFNLGKVESIHDDKIIMQTCDGAGRWTDSITEIMYSHITCVQIGNRYAKVYENFMMEKEI